MLPRLHRPMHRLRLMVLLTAPLLSAAIWPAHAANPPVASSRGNTPPPTPPQPQPKDNGPQGGGPQTPGTRGINPLATAPPGHGPQLNGAGVHQGVIAPPPTGDAAINKSAPPQQQFPTPVIHPPLSSTPSTTPLKP